MLFRSTAVRTWLRREKRERLFLTKRLKEGVKLRKEEDAKLVKTQMHLIRAPNGNLKQMRASRRTPLSRWTLKWKTWKVNWRGSHFHPLPNVWSGRGCWLKMGGAVFTINERLPV
ncbi:hypothetical protein TcWFU_003395 [Taenia crassiceps]|uniref:Uncharacterized protein n=1 Tax=Taenia crassiceps TaxID=6207 RepID=A0ABR4QJU3_9CEST